MGSSRLTICTWHLHHDFNFIGFYLGIRYAIHSYLPTINWLLIALHYHGQIYRGHLIVLTHVTSLIAWVEIQPLGRPHLQCFSLIGLWWKLCFWYTVDAPSFLRPSLNHIPIKIKAPFLAILQGHFAEFLKINYTITFSPLVLV